MAICYFGYSWSFDEISMNNSDFEIILKKQNKKIVERNKPTY